jgi:NAD(P)-dependent dehydrogenase (short-subunit alcohol dehydrogenase family)
LLNILQEFDLVKSVHLDGAFSCTKAAWPHFRKQKFGRVINTASAAGLYGQCDFISCTRGHPDDSIDMK